MNTLKQRLFNESKGWEMISRYTGGYDMRYKPNKEFLWMNTESEQIGFMSKSDIDPDEWESDFDDRESAEEILALQPGEMFDADGGINIYIRIK